MDYNILYFSGVCGHSIIERAIASYKPRYIVKTLSDFLCIGTHFWKHKLIWIASTTYFSLKLVHKIMDVFDRS